MSACLNTLRCQYRIIDRDAICCFKRNISAFNFVSIFISDHAIAVGR
jgi:hypothetical protein